MGELTKSVIRMLSRLGPCGAYGMAMNELVNNNKNLFALTADLCFYSGMERLKTSCPEQLINVGIAEQNLVGIAAGMAKEGLEVFASTYASFATTRALDQVRISMGYMQLPIKLVGLTSGFSVGILGATHISIEDISIMRSIPNVIVISPADCTEVYKAVMAIHDLKYPVYLRLTGTINTPMVYKEDYKFEIGKAIKLRKGKDIAIFAIGTMVYQALCASDILAERGIESTVINMHTIKPIDTDAISEQLGKKLIVTVEEHSLKGGLGGAVSEYLVMCQHHPKQVILGIADEFPHAASYEYLLDKYGLTAIKIANEIERAIKEEEK